MKFGMCVNVGLEKIEHVAKCGFDYVEYRFEHLAASSDEDFQALKDCLKNNNISCDAVNCFIPGKYQLIGENLDFTELKAYIEKGMSRATEIDLKTIVFGSGKARSIPEGMSYNEGFRLFVKFLKEIVAPIAEKYKITVVIEPLKRSETNFINTTKEGSMVAAAVDSEYIKVLGDWYHMYDGHDTADNVRDLKGCLKHAHIAEPVTRACLTLGTEDMYKDFILALEESGCERCSIEASHKSYEDFFPEIEEGIKVLRNIQKEVL